MEYNSVRYIMFSIWRKLHILAHQSRHLQRNYSSIEKKLGEHRARLKEVQDVMTTNLFYQPLIEEEKGLLQLIEKWEGVYERVLKQKSRAQWISYGDKNSKYFFAHLKARQARNKITSIYTKHGQKLTDPNLIQQKFIGFFQALLGIAADVLPYIDVTIARDGSCLTPEQQSQLLTPVIEADILQALKDVPLDKSPGIDGFNVEFFKNHWNII